MFKNFHNSLNSLEYQYSVIHNSLLHLPYFSNFQDTITKQKITYKKAVLSQRRPRDAPYI